MQESGFLPRRVPAVTGFDMQEAGRRKARCWRRDVDGQPFWYVPDGTATEADPDPLVNGHAA
jgi:hypothetical protein